MLQLKIICSYQFVMGNDISQKQKIPKIVQEKSSIMGSYQSGALSQISGSPLVSVRNQVVYLRSYWLQLQTKKVQVIMPCGSGIIVSSRYLITAAHNILSSRKGRFCNKLEVYQTNSLEISQDAERIQIEITEKNCWCQLISNTGKTQYQFDIAIVIIPPIVNKYSAELTICLSSYIFSSEEKIKVFVSGFPDLNSDDVCEFRQKKQKKYEKLALAYRKEIFGRLVKIEGNNIYYQIHTMSGQSGSPIFINMKKNGEQKLCLIGIHTSYSPALKLGRGVFFSEFITDLINKAISERYVGERIEFKNYLELKEEEKKLFSLKSQIEKINVLQMPKRIGNQKSKQMLHKLEEGFKNFGQLMQNLIADEIETEYQKLSRNMQEMTSQINQFLEKQKNFYIYEQSQYVSPQNSDIQRSPNSHNNAQSIENDELFGDKDLSLRQQDELQIQQIFPTIDKNYVPDLRLLFPLKAESGNQNKIDDNYKQIDAFSYEKINQQKNVSNLPDFSFKIQPQQILQASISQRSQNKQKNKKLGIKIHQPEKAHQFDLQIRDIMERLVDNASILYEKYEQNMQHFCQKHNQYFSYQCLDQFKIAKKYLCSFCMDIESGEHLNHQLICYQHHFKLEYKHLQTTKQRKYFCKKCLKPENAVKIDDKYHSYPIAICLEDACRHNQLLIYPESKILHEDHRNINFEKEQIRSYFYIEKEMNSNNLTNLLLLKQFIKFPQFDKIKQNHQNIILPILNFFQSIKIVQNSFYLGKVISSIVENQDETALKILMMHKNIQYEDKEKLDIHTDYMKEILLEKNQYFSVKINQLVQIMRSQLENVVDFSENRFQQAQQYFKIKYARVKNVKNNNITIKIPENIYEIEKKFYSIVKILIIEKDTEEFDELQRFYEKKRIRRQFWEEVERLVQIKQRFKQKEETQNSIKQEKQAIINEKFQYIVDIFQFFGLRQKYIYANIILQSYFIFKDKQKFQRESDQWPLLSYLLSQQMNRLTELIVKYDHVKCCDYNYQYKMNAYKLFQIIANNPELEKVQIQGIRLYHLSRFLKILRTMLTKGQEFINERNAKKESMNQYDSQHMNEEKKSVNIINRLQFHKIKQFSLRATLKISNSDVIRQLQTFMDFFPHISDLKLIIRFEEEIQCNSEIMKIFVGLCSRIQRLRISFAGQFLAKSIEFLKAIQDLTNIAAMYFLGDHMDFDDCSIKSCEKIINFIFQNNCIKKLSVKRFPNFPIPKQMRNLQELILVSIQNQQVDLESIFGESYNLNLLYLENIINRKQNESSLKQNNLSFASLKNIEYLHIINGDWVNDSLLLSLPSLALSSLKSIRLVNCPNITDASIQLILPSLTKIVTFDVSSTQVDPEYVLAIPSLYIASLDLYKNEKLNDNILRQIGLKWPSIRNMNIYGCSNIRYYGDYFPELLTLIIDPKLLSPERRLSLRLRGVQILPLTDDLLL